MVVVVVGVVLLVVVLISPKIGVDLFKIAKTLNFLRHMALEKKWNW